MSFAVASLASCIHDNFETPNIPTLEAGKVITISDLRQMHTDSVLSGIYPSGYKFTENFSIYCICTMDDKSGNIYKSAYVQDQSDAVNLHLLSSGGLYQGDSVRIDLKGLILGDYENMLQLDSVHVDNNIQKLATLVYVEPELVTLSQIADGGYQGRLIRLEKVEFDETVLGNTWADAVNEETLNYYLFDCTREDSVIVRTSGYADFAGDKLPENKGSLVAVVGQFRNDWQLAIRDIDEVQFNGYRCGTAVFEENFDDVVNAEVFNADNWTNIATQGTVQWTGSNNGVKPAITLLPSSDAVQQTWLVSPAIEIPSDEPAIFSFESREGNDRGGELKAFISTDYNGDVDAATWVEFTEAQFADAGVSGFSDWTHSGLLSLADYAGKNVHIAFRYDGTSAETAIVFLDSFLVSFE